MTDTLYDHTARPHMPADFDALLKPGTEKIFSLPFFTGLSEGLLPDQWRLYAKQFHVTCVSFDRLLHTTVENARKTDHTALIAELEENLADEMGTTLPKKTPHAVLRKKFFRALGLPEEEMNHDLGQVPLLQGTKTHTAEVDSIIHDGCVYKQMGAFLVQEFLATGPGFWILESGVSKSFPELAGRDKEPMEYVYGHIEHDAMEHFPALLQAVEAVAGQPDIRRKILDGATAMLNAEWALYNSFERDILGSKNP